MSRPRQYLGEPDGEYQRRLEEWERQEAEGSQQQSDKQPLGNGRQQLAEQDALAAIRKANAEPLPAKIVGLLDRGTQVVVQHARRRSPGRVQPGDGEIHLPFTHFYRPCSEAEAADANGDGLTLLPDEYQRRALYLRRVARDAIKIDSTGFMLWALDVHPVIGWRDPLNWIMVLDNGATAAQSDSAAASIIPDTGVVAAIRSAGDGSVVVMIDLDGGGSVPISMLPDAAPAKGTRGRIDYDGNDDPKFVADE